MVALEDNVIEKLQIAARRRDITLQELFRAVIIPDWVTNSIQQSQRTAGEGWDNRES
jgi:hypothetical protein